MPMTELTRWATMMRVESWWFWAIARRMAASVL